MKDFWENSVETKANNKLNKKKIIILMIVLIIIIISIILAIVYNKNKDFRIWMDKTILNKEVLQDNATTIELEDENAKVVAFNKNLGILSKNKFKIYNNLGNKEEEVNVEITNPIFESSNRFLAIADKDGQKIYVIEDKKIAWETQVEGNVSQIHINKNGYVAVVITGTSYKTVIVVYDAKGNALFTIYRSSTRLVDASISNDNKNLAIAEVDTSGTIIQSIVTIISVEKAQKEPSNSTIKTYNGQNNSLITNIKYQDKNKLICMYDDSIHIISNDKDETLVDISSKKVMFSSINLNNHIVSLEEQSSGLFTADSVVNITNIDNKNVNSYTAEAVTKEIYTYEDIIALNLGAEVDFINTDGWLVKKYIANQEITSMVISNSIAGIIYRDKVEIINL